jgi:hypothetical protein
MSGQVVEPGGGRSDGGKQGGGAVPPVVGSRGAGAEAGPRGFGPLTAETERDGVFGWVEIQSGNGFQAPANEGALAGGKNWKRWGSRRWVRQMRSTVESLIPMCRAMPRVVQRVASGGFSCVVKRMSSVTWSAVRAGRRPGRGASFKAGKALGDEAQAPARGLCRGDREQGSDLQIVFAFRSEQHDAGSFGEPGRRQRFVGPMPERRVLFRRECDGRSKAHIALLSQLQSHPLRGAVRLF